jgi:hypothetical protein
MCTEKTFTDVGSLRLRVQDSGVLIGKALLKIELRVYFVGMLFGLRHWCPGIFTTPQRAHASPFARLCSANAKPQSK